MGQIHSSLILGLGGKKPEGGDDFLVGDADAGLVFHRDGEAAGVVPHAPADAVGRERGGDVAQPGEARGARAEFLIHAKFVAGEGPASRARPLDGGLDEAVVGAGAPVHLHVFVELAAGLGIGDAGAKLGDEARIGGVGEALGEHGPRRRP